MRVLISVNIALLAILCACTTDALDNNTTVSRKPVFVFLDSYDTALISEEGKELLTVASEVSAVGRIDFVRIDTAAIRDSVLMLNFFSDTALAYGLVVEQHRTGRDPRDIWTGKVIGDTSMGYVRLAVYPGEAKLFGYIYRHGKQFSIYHIGSGLHVILEVDPLKMEEFGFYPIALSVLPDP